MKRFWSIVIVIVLASLLAACDTQASVKSEPTSLAAVSLTSVVNQGYTQTVQAALSKTQTPTLTLASTKTPQPTATPASTKTLVAAEESICPLSNKGIQVDFEKIPDKDGFYVLSDSMKELAAYKGCNFLIEGRQVLVEEHHIWLFLDPSWTLKILEGSLWAYPEAWNMGDFSTKKAPIAAELVTAKRNNQKENGYDWVIFVHVDKDVYEFPAGATTPKVVLPDNANFQSPEPIEVHGVWNGDGFDASIGAEKTITVALLDEKLVFWREAKDNVSYKSIQAWTMPSSWSFDQVKVWAEEKFPKKELLSYKAE